MLKWVSWFLALSVARTDRLVLVIMMLLLLMLLLLWMLLLLLMLLLQIVIVYWRFRCIHKVTVWRDLAPDLALVQKRRCVVRGARVTAARGMVRKVLHEQVL